MDPKQIVYETNEDLGIRGMLEFPAKTRYCDLISTLTSE